MSYFRALIRNIDKWILVLIVIFGIISITVISSTFYDTSLNITREVKVQFMAYILGFLVIAVVLLFDYKVFESWDKILYVTCIVLLLLPYVPGLGMVRNGARCWIHIGVLDFQPSELVKILFILVFAKFLSQRAESLRTFRGVLIAFAYAAPLILMILVEPDLGNATVISFIALGMVFCAGMKFRILAQLLGGLVVLFPLAYRFMEKHQRARIDAFLNPSDLSLPGNYQVWSSKISIGSGQLLGKGLFEGTQKKLKFLPVQQSDFIFAVIGEELGLIGGIVLIVLYGLFLLRIINIAENAKDFYGALIVTGIFSMFAFQVFENIGMTMGIMPVTGITLPFISYGGTSILVNMLAIGLVLNVGIRSKTINF